MNVPAAYLANPEQALNQIQRNYLQPLNIPQRMARRLLHGLTWCSVRALLRLETEGVENLPAEPPFILAPSHTSSLDPFLLTTALPYEVMKNCHWAAAARAILKSRFRRVTNRLGGSIPIWGGRSALAAGMAVLDRGKNLIWFPEGHRTRSGKLQPLRPGIGLLAVHAQVPVVPIRILGGYEAMPPGRHFPKFGSRICIRIGKPLWPEPVSGDAFDAAADRFTKQLYEALAELGDATEVARGQSLEAA